MNTIRYRIAPVTRFVLTRWESAPGEGVNLNTLIGEMDSYESARRVVSALSGTDQYPPRDIEGDETKIRGAIGGSVCTFNVPSESGLQSDELRDIENHIRAGYGVALGTRPSSPEDDFPLTINRDHELATDPKEARRRILQRRDQLVDDLNTIHRRSVANPITQAERGAVERFDWRGIWRGDRETRREKLLAELARLDAVDSDLNRQVDRILGD